MFGLRPTLVVPGSKALAIVAFGVVIVVVCRFLLGQLYPELISLRANILGGIGLGISVLICAILLIRLPRSTQGVIFSGLLGFNAGKFLTDVSSQTLSELLKSFGRLVDTLGVAISALFGLSASDAGSLLWGFVSTTTSVMLISFFFKHDVDAELVEIVNRLKSTSQTLSPGEMDLMRDTLEKKI